MLALGSSIAVAAGGRLERLEERLQAKLDSLHSDHGFAGASVGFVLHDGARGAVAVGFSDVEAQTPLAVDDRLLSGSIGKTYAAAVALQLVGEKKIDLDEKISRCLGDEEWFSRLPNGADITVRMLMNHTSGIPEHVLLPEFGKAIAADPDRVWRPDELVAYILGEEPRFAAGKGWSYADTNYIVLGMIIEKVTGNAYYDELKKRILVPLGLDDTVPSDSRKIPGLVNGYAGERSPFGMPGRTIRDGAFVVNPQMEWTGGGLASTPLDLARWARAFFHAKAFPARLMEEVLDGVPAATKTGDRYGLGVQFRSSPLGVCLGHGGWFPGYISLVGYYREHDLAVAIQFNTSRSAAVRAHLIPWLDELAACLTDRNADRVVGEYSGFCHLKDGTVVFADAKVIAEGDGLYRAVVTAQTETPATIELRSNPEADGVVLIGSSGDDDWLGTFEKGRFQILPANRGIGTFSLLPAPRRSPTEGLAPPEGAIVLLPFEEGSPTTLEAWTNKNWKLLPDGSMMVARGPNRTVRDHGSGLFHIEFKTPVQPEARGQGRGNSGVYFESRYEVQILDSFGLTPGMGDCGSIYGVAITGQNACLPPGVWQTYDVIFRAPREKADGSFEPAQMTVFHNGVKIHENQPVPGPTTAAPEKQNAERGPLYLQDHGNPVCYRNIWYLELPE